MASPKEGLAIIIGKLKSQDKQNPYGQHAKLGDLLKKPDDKESDDEMSASEAQVEAAKDFLMAIESKDPAAVAESFKDMMELCHEDMGSYDDQDVDSDHSMDHSSMMTDE